jgi:pimeloyl-ACP methyl ester carboxylesterase
VRSRTLSFTALARRTSGPPARPVPPADLPPGRIVHVRGRGEYMLRDTGPPAHDGPVVLLLHGWMVTADLNWVTMYTPLRDAGYRVLAMDHRGHGRGMRSPEPFRLEACAADAAAVLRTEGIDRVLAVGYSMGGPIACLLARDHPELVDGLVLCATAPDWQEPYMRRAWRAMTILRLQLGLFGDVAWRGMLRRMGLPDSPATSWAAAELSRGDTYDIAEAGRELGRFDGRPWISGLSPPAAVLVARDDDLVPPSKQHELARLMGGPAFEVPGRHTAVTFHAEPFADALLRALSAVGSPATLQAR